MIVENYITAWILSIILLVPLGWKWCIRMRIVMPSVVVIGFLSGVLTHIALYLLPDIGWILKIILQIFFILALTISGILFRFYRDPERRPPTVDGVILSPADGEVIYIKKINANESLLSNKKGAELPLNEEVRKKYFSSPVYVIGIMMNFLHVHVIRAPIGGRVEFIQHINGKFLSLKRKEAYFQNERAVTAINSGSFRVGVIQIASRLARRIVSFIKLNDAIQIGQRTGVIKLGSQVDVIIPFIESLNIEIKTGQEVKAGLSILASYHSNELNSLEV